MAICIRKLKLWNLSYMGWKVNSNLLVGILRTKIWFCTREQNFGIYIELRRESGNNSLGINGYCNGIEILKFFHALASERRRSNRISYIKVNNQLVENPKSIRKEITKHFQRLYGERKTLKLEEWSCGIRQLTGDSAMELEHLFFKEEAWGVIKDYDGDKALGPDRFIFIIF